MRFGRFSRSSHRKRAVPVGGMYPRFHDCKIPTVFGSGNDWFLPDSVFARFREHSFRGFFRKFFATMDDAEVQIFLEWDGFHVARCNGCFVLKKGARQITVSAARARDVLLCSVIGVLN